MQRWLCFTFIKHSTLFFFRTETTISQPSAQFQGTLQRHASNSQTATSNGVKRSQVPRNISAKIKNNEKKTLYFHSWGENTTKMQQGTFPVSHKTYGWIMQKNQQSVTSHREFWSSTSRNRTAFEKLSSLLDILQDHLRIGTISQKRQLWLFIKGEKRKLLWKGQQEVMYDVACYSLLES